jgi:type I restriction enzyme S subunit
MSAKWPLKKLSDVAEFLNNKRIPLKSLDRDKRQGEYPYYGASGVVDHIDDYVFDGIFLLISEDGENLRTRNTPIAFKASGKFWVNNHAHILAEKEEGILDYLEYYFSKLDITPYITGAVQPKLNKANLDSIEIPIPPKEERLGINKILNSFTDKIELNRQTNQTLEHMAQAIFKSWFVDFEPTRAKIAAKEEWAKRSMTAKAGGSDNNIKESQAEAAFVERAAMAAISGRAIDSTNDSATGALAGLDQLNTEQIQQLKTTAALFPDMLVDSELGEIPEGWEVSSLGNEVDFATGFSFKSKDFSESGIRLARGDNVKEGQFLWGAKARYWPVVDEGLEKYLLESGDVLISMDGSKVGKNWVRVGKSDLPCLLVQRVARLRSSGSIGSSILEILIGSNSFLRYVNNVKTGTSIPHISGKQIKDLPVVSPSDEGILFQIFEAHFLPMAKKREENIVENVALEKIKGSLLPVLLSGEFLLPGTA